MQGYMTISQLTIHRARAGLTQAELAEKAGVSGACVSRIEAGVRAGYNTTKVRLADALGVDVNVLFPA